MKTCAPFFITFLLAVASIAAENETSKSMETLPLTPEGKIPIVGLGTWMAQEDELEKAMEAALQAGYRHVDTAYAYQNEHVIGRVLKRWLDAGKLKRSDLFIVSKLPPCGNRPEGVEKFLGRTLKDLQVDYLDLYLVHTPFAFADVNDDPHPMKDGKMIIDPTTDHVAVWKAMEKQVDAGKVKAIGLSNFNESQVTRVLNNARIKPACMQMELHAYMQLPKYVEFLRKNGMVVTAYSPLGAPGLSKFVEALGKTVSNPSLFEDPTVLALSKKYGKSPAQILLRHAIQKGLVVIPKSTNPERLRQNLDIFNFNLDDGDMKSMNALDRNQRFLDFTVFPGIEEHPEWPY